MVITVRDTDTGKAMSTDGGDSMSIDIELLATTLTEKMNTNLCIPPECCIFQTPETLSRDNKYAYIPDAFAIGPFHHGRTPNIKSTEKIKLNYLHGILNRPSKKNLQELLKAVSQFEEKARRCYASPVEPDPSKFVEMLVIDGCFIIELFRKDDDNKLREFDDPIFTMSNLLQNLNHDLILLENQIPWFVLDILFNLSKIPDEHQVPLEDLALKFFGNIFMSDGPKPNEYQWEKIRSRGTKHILDLLRNFLIYSYEEDRYQSSYGWMPLPSATTLKQSGVAFKPVSGMSILDVQFINGCLEIPSILIQETTETIFRNLVSLEQCVSNYSPRITSYVKLMTNLINTREDIRVLHKNKIVDNWVNLEEATKIFNRLYTDTYLKEFHYSQLCKRVDAYRRMKIPKARYHFFQTYGPAIAITIFFLTILQTVLTILQTVCDVKEAWIK